MARKSADSLIDNPVFQQQAQPPELPVRTALSKLTTTKGDDLEMTTRATPQIVRAAQVGYIYARIYGSSYIQGRVEQMERLAVSMGGQGRRDLIDTVEAIDPQAGATQPAPGMKRCARCGEWKPLAGFGTESRLKDGKKPYCHECVSLMGKEYRQRARQAKDGKKTIG